MANPKREPIVSTTSRSVCVNASCRARYRASTAAMSDSPSRGTANAERRVLYFVGSLRYPGSTDGLPFTIGLWFCATHPDKPSPQGILNAENRWELSPLTNSALRVLLLGK